MSSVTLRELTKQYAGNAALSLDSVSLDVAHGEFVCLVGPSGCGKTTALRMIAGLESVTSGEIEIGDRVVNDLAPRDRDIALVFQSYALYPHMTVFGNMSFGLKLRKVPKDEIDAAVTDAARILDLEQYLDRKPAQLSGGQRQRVALGRAIVRNPAAFLMDEPLSNLDAKLRVQTRAEIARLHHRLGATMIYVTHDQVEAMTMGDRICVMKDGDIMQVAEPLELYNRPRNLFVAGFIGSPPMNFFRGFIRRAQGRLVFAEDNPGGAPVTVALDEVLARRAAGYVDRKVVLGIRPEGIRDTQAGVPAEEGRTAEVRVEVSEPMGSETLLYLDSGATAFIARVGPTDRFEAGERVRVAFDLANAHIFDAATELALA